MESERCIAYFSTLIALGIYRKLEIEAPKEIEESAVIADKMSEVQQDV